MAFSGYIGWILWTFLLSWCEVEFLGHFCIEVGYSCLVKVGESALKFQLVVVWVKSGLWALLLGGQDSCDRKVRK